MQIVCLLLLASAVCGLPISGSGDALVHLKFDDNFGSSVFIDSSPYQRQGSCSSPQCPLITTGVSGKAASFAASCARSYTGSSADATIASSCGSRVSFSPASFRDGTVMLWYSEAGLQDGNPVVISQPEAPRVTRHFPGALGADLSLVGGSDFFLGRLGRNQWGGYWCGQWHVSKPISTFGDSERGWDYLGWHHFAVSFAGSSAVLYIDGNIIAVFSASAECVKSTSALGERSVRYTQQNGFRPTEQTGGDESRPRANGLGVYQNVLESLNWSSNFYKGLIDDFRVVSRALSQDDIKSAMMNV